MGVFKEMDPEIIRRSIEGYQDELSKEREEQLKLYQSFSCPRCRCHLDEEIDIKTAYRGNGLLHCSLLRCANCDYRIDPHSNIVLNYGSPAKIPLEILPIIGGKYIKDG